jgi:CRP-like cAMP-binding protein
MADARALRLERQLVLAALGLRLDTLDGWVVDRITSSLEEQLIVAGQTLFMPGEPPEYLYFAHTAAIRVLKEGSPSWTLHARWFIGGFDAFREPGRIRQTVALADFPALRLEASAWIDLLEDSFMLARRAISAVSGVVESLEARVRRPPASESRSPPWLPPSGSALTPIERLGLLTRVDIFESAAVQAVVDLAAASREVEFGPGETVIARGTASPHLVVLIDGEVTAARTESGAERRFRALDVVCFAAAFADNPIDWHSIATKRTRALLVPLPPWFDLLEDHFSLFRSFMSALAARREVLLDSLGAETGNVDLT